MLSSLSSFFPSRLHGTASKDLLRSTVNPVEGRSDDEDEPEAPVIASQAGDKPAKIRDGKGPTEVFVLRVGRQGGFVRT